MYVLVLAWQVGAYITFSLHFMHSIVKWALHVSALDCWKSSFYCCVFNTKMHFLFQSLSEIQFLVLDEADELLTPGFLAQIRNVLNGCPQGKQMMLFSATIPEHIMRIAEE